MTLQVIGAGLPRTGTLSLKLALEQLGYSRCFHLLEMPEFPERWPLWTQALERGPADWDAIFAGYRATTDSPCCFFYEELAERYPKAKVILSTRSAESWVRSVRATVGSSKSQARLMISPMGPLLTKMYAYGSVEFPRMFEALIGDDDDQAAEAFTAWNEDVRRTIPPERLLVFEAAEGWAPLCEFLGKPVPDNPYPRVNERDGFAEILARFPQ